MQLYRLTIIGTHLRGSTIIHQPISGQCSTVQSSPCGESVTLALLVVNVSCHFSLCIAAHRYVSSWKLEHHITIMYSIYVDSRLQLTHSLHTHRTTFSQSTGIWSLVFTSFFYTQHISTGAHLKHSFLLNQISFA